MATSVDAVPSWEALLWPDPTPFLVLRGNPWSVLWTRRRRCHGVVPSLEASSCCSRSSGGTAQFGIGFYYGCGPPWRNVHHHGRSLDNAVSRSTKALPSTCQILLGTMGGVCWSVLASSFGLVAKVSGVGCDTAWLLCGLPHRHQHEVDIGEACIVVPVVGVFGGCGC